MIEALTPFLCIFALARPASAANGAGTPQLEFSMDRYLGSHQFTWNGAVAGSFIYDRRNIASAFARASRGKLNSPWGLVEAPFNFGRFSTNILIGNFGDGQINAFEAGNSHFRGQLTDISGKTIVIDALWALEFGGAMNSDPGILYFTSGPDNEQHGLLGSIAPQS